MGVFVHIYVDQLLILINDARKHFHTTTIRAIPVLGLFVDRFDSFLFSHVCQQH